MKIFRPLSSVKQNVPENKRSRHCTNSGHSMPPFSFPNSFTSVTHSSSRINRYGNAITMVPENMDTTTSRIHLFVPVIFIEHLAVRKGILIEKLDRSHGNQFVQAGKMLVNRRGCTAGLLRHIPDFQ